MSAMTVDVPLKTRNFGEVLFVQPGLSFLIVSNVLNLSVCLPGAVAWLLAHISHLCIGFIGHTAVFHLSALSLVHSVFVESQWG